MTHMRFSQCTVLSAAILLIGCVYENNPTPPAAESDSLTEIIQLTRGFDRAGEAYFSRDMRWIIFQAAMTGEPFYSMYIAQVKTGPGGITGITPPVRITSPGTWNSCGDFSPDGTSIIFSSTTGRAPPATAPSGSSYQWLFSEGAEIFHAQGWQGAISGLAPGASIDLAQHKLTDNNAYDAENAYSADGKWIIFTSNRTGDLEVWAMRSDGKDAVQLTSAPGYDGGPFFSPDGKRIIYRSDRKGDKLLQVFTADLVFDASGKITGARNERQLTKDAFVNWGPYWHPDGKHMVYATSAHGYANFELYLMRDDGSRKTRITFAPGADVLPVFSPDGNYLLWSAKRDGQTTQVYLARFRFPEGS